MDKLSYENIADAVNLRFATVEPGYGQAADAPVMTTPMVPAAVAMTVQGSTLCLVC